MVGVVDGIGDGEAIGVGEAGSGLGEGGTVVGEAVTAGLTFVMVGLICWSCTGGVGDVNLVREDAKQDEVKMSRNRNRMDMRFNIGS